MALGSCVVGGLGVAAGAQADPVYTPPAAMANTWEPISAVAGATCDTHSFSMVWVDGNGAADNAACITQDEETQLAQQDVAAYDEATGAALPSDIPAATEQAGTSLWDSFSGASTATKTSAFEGLLDAEGVSTFEAAIGTVPTIAAAGATFYLGWQIGTGIADLFGLNETDGSTAGPGQYMVSDLRAVEAGKVLLQGSWNEVDLPHQRGFITTWTGGAGFPQVLSESTEASSQCYTWPDVNPPAGSEIVTSVKPWQTCNSSTGAQEWGAAWFTPLKVAELPGPGQGSFVPSSGQSQQFNGSGGFPAASEAQVLSNAKSTLLSDPAAGAFQQAQCAQPANSFCSAVSSAPQTGWIKLPAITPNETYPQYLAALQAAGVVGQVSQSTLTDTQSDPSVGPNAVVRSSPAAGTYVAPSSAVTVYTNPDSSPSAPPGGGAPSTPALPGISIPTLATPCSVFPFGIPCWIVNQLDSLVSSSPTAPSFTIGTPAVLGGTPLEINLDHPFGADLSGVMAIARPVLLFLSFIGLVLWLGGMAMGGSTGGGGSAAAEEE